MHRLAAARQPMESTMQNLYESPPMKIGKHFWRIVVRSYEMPDGRVTRCTAYEFKRPAIKAGGFMVTDDTWRSHREWPGYDFNDGTYGGSPKTLRKLWEANRVEIERIIHGKEPAQMELL
jgi:hypothetical protein